MRASTFSGSFGRAMTVGASAALVAATLVAPGAAASPASGGPLAPLAAATSFSDVDETNPFKADIDWLASEGITTGYPDGTFRPTGSVNRDAMAAFLYRLTVGPAAPAACTAAPFSDVAATHPFCPHISWLVTTGVTTGWPDGTYRPGTAVSREAMAAFLYRLANDGADAPACTADPFDDVAAADPFCGEITWLAEQEVTTGWPDGTFRPGASIERQAMAAFLHRFAALTSEPPADDPAPLVSIDAPLDGSVVRGTVTVATSWLASGLAGVELLVDGAVTATATTEPFDLTWDTTTTADGTHTITVVGTDAAGRLGTSAPVTVTVSQAPDPVELLEADRTAGTLTADEYARYGVLRWSEPELVPEQYRVAPDASPADLTVPLLTALYGDPDTDPAVRQELLDSLRADGPDNLPVGPFTPEQIAAALAPFEPALDEAAPGDGLQAIGADVGYVECATEQAGWERVADPTVPADFPRMCTYVTDLISYTYFGQPWHAKGVDEATDDVDHMLRGVSDAMGGPNGIPDDLDEVHAAFADAYRTYVELGFTAPQDYIQVDFRQMQGNSLPGGAISMTLSSTPYLMRHELFHQFQYSDVHRGHLIQDFVFSEQTTTGWWLEATAEWAAHRAQDDVHGVRSRSEYYHLARSCVGEKITGGDVAVPCYARALPAHLRNPQQPLALFVSQIFHSADPQYGAFLFAEWLDVAVDPAAVRETWRAIGDSTSTTGTRAIDHIEALLEGTYATSLRDVVLGYHLANYTIPRSYPDADADDWATLLDGGHPPSTDVPTGGTWTVGGTVGVYAGGAKYLDLRLPPGVDGSATTITVDASDAGAAATDLGVQYQRLTAGGEPCGTWDGDPAFFGGTTEVATQEITLFTGCPRAVVVISHADAGKIGLDGPLGLPRDGMLMTADVTVANRPVGVVSLAGPTTPVTGPDAAVAAVGDYSAGYLLNADGTVAQYTDERIAPVEGLAGVTQLAIGTGGNNGASRSGYAVAAGGRLERLAGTTHAPLDPGVTGVRSIATFWDTAVYALMNDGTLLFIDDLAITPVAGAANVVQVETWSYGRYGGGLARTADGGVLYLAEATAAPFPVVEDAAPVVAIEATWFGEGYAVRADGTVDVLRVAPYATPADPTAHRVPGISDAVGLVAPESGDMAAVLTAAGGLLLVDCADQACADVTVRDTGLTGVETAVARYGFGAQTPLWALLGTGELYDVYLETDDLGNETVQTVSTGLTDVVSLDQSTGLRYVVHADGRVTWRSGGGSSMQVGSITSAERVFCAYDRCFVGFD